MVDLLKPPKPDEPLQPKPIRDLPPLETGGIELRQGIGVQDHAAAGFCIQMVTDTTLAEVWCERHDDLTLIWKTEATEIIEFVQVKSNELDQLWSIAKICEKELKPTSPGGIGTSILEKLLANDRALEPCRFRVITSRPVNSDLKVLTYPLGSQVRTDEINKELVKQLREKVGNFCSGNQHDCEFWVENTVWEVVHAQDAIQNRNLVALGHALEALQEYAAWDQLQELYKRIVAKMWETANHDWWKPEKRLSRLGFIKWLKLKISEMLHPKQAAGRLKRKMTAAKLSKDAISAAATQRDFYRRETLVPKYWEVSDTKLIESEVSAILLVLRAKLDAGEISNSGPEFHAKCLEAITVVSQMPQLKTQPSKALLNGCMYSITDRCQHRFMKVTP